MARIDGVAESFELSRLEAMGVLERLPAEADLTGFKRLSTQNGEKLASQTIANW